MVLLPLSYFILPLHDKQNITKLIENEDLKLTK